MAFTTAEENRIQAIEDDLALLIEKVELNMVTKTDWRAFNLTLERAIQDIQSTGYDIPGTDDSVSLESLFTQLNTLRDLVSQLHP